MKRVRVILFIMNEFSEFEDPSLSSSSDEKVATPTPQEIGSLLAAETDFDNLQKHLRILRDVMAPADAAQALALGVRGGEKADALGFYANNALDAVAGAFG